MDESGDGVIFDSRGRVLIATGKVQDYFILGMVEFSDLSALEREWELSLIWPKVALLVDADDLSEKPYGTYHSHMQTPLDLEKMKNRKVEDSEP